MNLSVTAQEQSDELIRIHFCLPPKRLPRPKKESFPLGGKTRCAFDRSTVRRSYNRKTQETGKRKDTVATRPSVMLCPCSL